VYIKEFPARKEGLGPAIEGMISAGWACRSNVTAASFGGDGQLLAAAGRVLRGTSERQDFRPRPD